ncbi:MAG: amidohydrolase family protein [Terriglobia bacterium]
MRPRNVSPPPRRGAGSILALGLAAMLVGLPSLSQTERPNEPRYFAIRNARLVPVSDPVIEKGTIVLANGLIQAVGTDVTIPPEAWVIEGAGLTVYPGLIDALTNLGLQAAEAAGRPPAPGQSPQPRRPKISRGPEDRPATTSWKNAADLLTTADKRLENWRKAGFTSAVTVPDNGIFPGEAAFINLAGKRPNELVVKTPVALRINFRPLHGFWSFPGSLIGVVAYVKQVFLDADQYGKAWTIYESNPRGQERPPYDRALEPIRQSRTAGWPVLIPATWAKEIRRAVRVGEAVEAKTLLYGAHQGYLVAEALASKQLPVLVSLKWPEKPKDADPEVEEPLRVLRFRDRAPSTPAALHKAGVQFAFYSDGLVNPKDILKNVKKAIEAGLPPAAALRALTLSAAEIYGVDDRLGSLEVGKLANLALADGDLFDEKTKVKMVFIDGRKYVIREPGRPTDPPTVNLTGKWTLTVHTPQGVRESTADLTMTQDGTLSGTLTGRRGTSSLTRGWVSGNKFSFTVSFAIGPRSLEATYTGRVEGNRMSGTVTIGRHSTDFTGTRPDAERDHPPRAGFVPLEIMVPGPAAEAAGLNRWDDTSPPFRPPASARRGPLSLSASLPLFARLRLSAPLPLSSPRPLSSRAKRGICCSPGQRGGHR